ncbi:putative rossmann-like alpha/beta/alpha sandwich protein [Helianthus debilis subsp. tardiflorus]
MLTSKDLNIGIALWLAAGGDGWVSEEIGTDSNNHSECQRIKYKSESRILLVGSGADEQCAGYGRHKTKYKKSRLERQFLADTFITYGQPDYTGFYNIGSWR